MQGQQQAATALQAAGIRLVVAGSYSQTYLRNAINNGFICVECPALSDAMKAHFADRADRRTIIGDDPLSAVPQITTYALYQNSPNPFNPLTNFKYGVAVEGRISINIYDVRGMKVITLLDQVVRPGTYNIVWDGTDSGGRRVASGIYMARFKSVDQTQVQRMTLIK